MFPVSDVIPSRTTPYVTIGLIALTTCVFLVEVTLGDDLTPILFESGVVPALFSWPTLLTGTFLHVGWVHCLGNMLYLWLFGDNVENRLGHRLFAAFYLASGAAAAVGHVAFNPHSAIPVIGAAGAVSAVMGAYFVLYPQSRVLTAVLVPPLVDLVEVPAVFFLGVWVLLQLFTDVGSLARAEGAALWPLIVGFTLGAMVGGVCRLRAKRSYWSEQTLRM